MDKLNNTELVSGANNSSRSSVNHHRGIHVSERSIYSKVLLGLFMLVLGVITLSLPVVANAQLMQPADYYKVPYGSNVISEKSPYIFAHLRWSQYVGFYPRLWRRNINGTWDIMRNSDGTPIGTWQSGIAYAHKPWVGTPHRFELQHFGAGFYMVSADMYRHNGTRWVPIGNDFVYDYDNYFLSCGSGITLFNSVGALKIPATCSWLPYGRYSWVYYSIGY